MAADGTDRDLEAPRGKNGCCGSDIPNQQDSDSDCLVLGSQASHELCACVRASECSRVCVLVCARVSRSLLPTGRF